ncbi:MAG: tol-pal system protein YbgF [Nitrospinae bacterium]|nr:tol-pal system protein YbgF [Nitrospinota bacterium]
MKTFKASRLQAFALAALSLVLLGCPEANSPAGDPGGAVISGTSSPPRPAPSVQAAAQNLSDDVAAIEQNLQGLRRGMRNQEQRIEEARQAIQGVTDEVERARKDSEKSLEKAEEVIAKLTERVEKLENEVSQLRSKPPLVAAQKKVEVVVTAVGAPSRMSPVGIPPANPRIASVGLPLSQDAQAAGQPVADARVAVIPKEPASRPQKPAPAPRLPDPEEDYTQAIRVLRDERNFAKARGLLNGFISKYPTHELADDAQYWIGQSYFQEKNFERAILAFNKVQVDYANGDKAPEALLLEALSFLNIEDRASARELLGQVIAKYPDSSAASTARKRLESL